MTHVCALPGCSLTVGSKPFRLGSYPGLYCSNDCVNEAFMLKKAGKVFAKDPKETILSTDEKTEDKKVKVQADDFGDAGVIRRYCDNQACCRPVTLSWKSRSGKEYCSNECLKTEKPKENKTMTTEDTDSPVSVSTSPKKGGKKAVKKAVAKKKAAPAAKKATAKTATAPRSKYPNDATITVKKTDHDQKGKRAEALTCLLKNQTVAKFKEALAKKEAAGSDRLSTYAGWAMNTATEAGLVTIK